MSSQINPLGSGTVAGSISMPAPLTGTTGLANSNALAADITAAEAQVEGELGNQLINDVQQQQDDQQSKIEQAPPPPPPPPSPMDLFGG